MYQSTRKNRSGSRRFSTAFIKRLSSWLVLSTALTVGTSQCARAASVYWDGDATNAGNVLIPPTLIGGDGTWDNGITLNWWDGISGTNQVWNNTNLDTAVFTGTAGTVTVDAGGVTAGGLTFNTSGFVLTGGTITLSAATGVQSPVIAVNGIGTRDTISSVLAGTSGFSKTGAGALVLTNANTFSGDVAIKDGSVVITDTNQLGVGTSAIGIFGIGNTGNPGFSGGQLVLAGATSSVTLSRDIAISGRGPNAVNSSGGLVSVGANTISGGISGGSGASEARVVATHGNTLVTGNVNTGNGGALIFSGTGNVIISGQVTGSDASVDRFIKAGGSFGSTMWLQNASNNFAGAMRVDSFVRVSTNSALGSGVTNGVDFNFGTLEIRTDAPDFASRNIRTASGRSGTIFMDRAIGGSGLNQNFAFGSWDNQNNSTLTFQGRDGNGATLGAVTWAAGNNTAIASSANGTVTLSGLITRASETNGRTLSLNATGDMVLSGGLTQSDTGAVSVTKNNVGSFTLSGAFTGVTGSLNISQGTVVLTNLANLPTGTVNLGNGTTIGGTLNYTGAAGTLANAINLNTTTGNAYLNASGTGALTVNGSISNVAGGPKTFFLGGTNTADNTITSVIPTNGTNVTNLQKSGPGTWVLNPTASNTYTGSTTVANGVLKLQEAAGNFDILPDAGAVVFGVDTFSQAAGGTLNYIGASAAASTETAGALTSTAGHGVITATPTGVGGTATLTFGSIGTRTPGGTINISNTGTVNITGTAGFINSGLYFNGSDFAFSGVGTTLRAPVYGTDAGFVTAGASLTAASHNQMSAAITGQATAAINSLKINGANDLTLGATQVLTIGTAAGSGIILTGGSSTISGGSGVAVSAAANDFAIRVEGSNTLTINTPLTTSTAGLTKSGAGTLQLGANNTITGAGKVQINEGTLQLGVGGTLGATDIDLVIRQGGTFNLNGVNVGTAGSGGIDILTGAGAITNTGSAALLRVGNGNSAALFTGAIGSGITLEKGGSNTLSLTNTTNAFEVLSLRAGTVEFALPSGATTWNANVASPVGLGATAAGLVFNGGALRYTGANGAIFSETQTPSITTDRQFTLAGSGTIESTGRYGNNVLANGGSNNAAMVWTNTSDLTFSGAGARTLTLTGDSTGDNELRAHLVNNGTDAFTFVKAGNGLWILNPASSNTFSGPTQINAGALQVAPQSAGVQGLSANSNIQFNGGVLQTSGAFNIALGTGAGQLQFIGTGGFAASTSKLTVNLGSGATLALGTAPTAGSTLLLNSTTALSDVELVNPINLGTANRTIQVDDNSSTTLDFATVSGVISGGAGGTLTRTGGGTLILGNANTYVGNTIISGGNTFVTSIGGGATPSSSLGAGAGALVYNADADNINVLYVGAGETSSRALTFTGTTHTANRTWRLESSGSGPLVMNGAFTNTVPENATGRTLTLELRGTNTDGNQMNMVLTNSTGTNAPLLAVSKQDGGVWILNPASANTFTGSISVGGGMLGLTTNGIGAAANLTINNGGVFAFGGPLTTSKPVQGNNSTAVFGGPNAMTFNGTLTKTSGQNDWNISNNLEGGALLTFNGGFVNAQTTTDQTINWRGTGSTVYNGVIANSSSTSGRTFWNISIAPDASFTFGGASANTYSGTTTFAQGTLILNKTLGVVQIGNGTSQLTWNGGVITSTAGALTGVNALANPTFLNGDPVTFSGANNIELSGVLTNNNGNRVLQNELATLTLSGPVSLSQDTNSRTLTLAGSGATVISGVVRNNNGPTTNTSSLTYSGTGSLLLSNAANSATGTLTVNRNIVTLGDVAGNGIWAGTTTVNQGGTLRLDNTGATANRLADANAVTLAGGTLDFIGNVGGSSETAGALTVNQSAGTITMSGAGTNTLTFASVNFANSGSSLDLTSIAGLGTTNNVVFTAAPTLSNGILPRIFVNGGADFATHTLGSIGAYAAYNNSNNLNTAAATDTMNLTASAATTENRSVNAIKLNGSSIDVTGAASNRLTVSSGGILNTGGNNSLSVNEVAFGATTPVIQVATGTTLTINSDLTGTANFAKALGGNLTFGAGARSFVTGTHNLMGGTTTLNGGADTFFPNQALNLPVGGTLDLNGGGQYVGALTSATTIPGTGGNITNGAIATNANGVFGGVVSGASTHFAKVGNAGALTFGSAQTYGGQTLVGGNTLNLENDATLLNTSSIVITGGNGTLSLNNNNGLQTQINNRIGDAIPITLAGGSININGRAAINATETLGALSATMGANGINLSNNNGSGSFSSMDVTFASLTRSTGATINFTGNTLGQAGNSSRVVFTSPLTAVGSGALGAWAIANSTDYAAYNTGMGVGIVGQGGYTGYDATFAPGNITEVPRTTNGATILPTGITSTDYLKLSSTVAGVQNDILFAAGTDTLNLVRGGLLRNNISAGSLIGTETTRGILTAGPATAGTTELVIFNANTTTASGTLTGTAVTNVNSITLTAPTTTITPGMLVTGTGVTPGTYVTSVSGATIGLSTGNSLAASAALTFTPAMVVNSNIQDVSGVSLTSLVKSGGGALVLTGQNTYTGGTYISQGSVQLSGPGTGSLTTLGTATYEVIPAGGITLTNASLTMNRNQGQINPTNAVTLNGGSTLTLVGNNTLASLNFNNNGGTGNPTVTTGGFLTLTGATPITVSSAVPTTVPTINGNVDIGSGAKTINTPAIQLGGITLTKLTPTLNIAANILSPGATLTKTGNGILQLGGQNTFSSLTVSGGGILISGSSNPTSGGTGISGGPLGGGSVSMAAGTTLLVDGNRSVGNDITFAGTPTFDATANTTWTLSLGGTLNGLANGASPIEISNPALTVALLGNIPNITSVTSFNKTGLGTLIFNAKGYSGNFDAAALGNPLAVSLLHDGDGTGVPQNISLPGNVIFQTGATGTITVNRAGGTLPFNQAANKIISAASINTVLTNGLNVVNSNGYGLRVADSGSLVGTPTFSVGTATASNVTQGLYMGGLLGGTGFNKTGGGTMVLENIGNTFLGNINIQQGVVSVSSDAPLGDNTNLIQLNPGTATTGLTSTFRATGSFTLGHTIQLTNATANTRAIEVSGGQTLTINTPFDLNAGAGNTASLAKNDNGTLNILASNAGWSGTLSINAGAVLIDNSVVSPLGTGTISIAPGAANLGAALQLTGGVTVTQPLTTQGNNNVLLGGINSGGQLQSVSGSNTYSGAIAINFDSAFGADAGATLTLAGPITIGNQTSGRNVAFIGAGDIIIGTGATVTGNFFGLRKYGTGTMNIQVPFGTQAGTDGVQVRNGVLVLSAGGTTNSTGAANQVFNGATLRLNNTGANLNNRLSGRAVTLTGGTFDFIANNTTETAGALTSNEGGNTIINGGSGTSALTFASLAQGSGSSLNVTGTFGSASNFVKFTTAPGLTNGLLPRVTTNGNEFATYNGTNGIVAYTGYSVATNILGVTPTQTFKATAGTANSLTGNQTINALTLSSGPLIGNSPNVGGLGGLNPATLTISSGAILATGTGAGASSTLSVPIISLGAEGAMHVASGQTLNVTSGIFGTAGLAKNLPGTLNFNAQQFYSGTTYVNGGTLNLNGGTNTLLFNNGLSVNSGGTLNLNGTSQFVAGLSSASASGSNDIYGGTVTNLSGTQSTFTINGNTNFAGEISGNIFLNKTGTGALNFQKAQTYTGGTIISGGTLTLNDYGTLPLTNTNTIDIRYGTLTFGNGNITNLNNRVNDSAPITLSGGTLNYGGRQQMDTTETLGAVTLAQSHNSIFADDGNSGLGSAVLTIASLSRSDASATLRFNNLGDMGQIGTRGRVMITANPTLTNNIIGPWAIIDRDYASYDATYGVIGLDRVGAAGSEGRGLNTSPLATDNVRFSTTGTTVLANDTTVYTLNFNSQNANTILDLNGKTLTLAGGGLLLGQNSDNVDFAINNGTLTSGVLNTASDLFLFQANYGGTNRTVNIGAVIANNGTGAVRLIKDAGDNNGVTTLNSVNTYTGGTVINYGTLNIGATGALGTGGITVSGGTLTQAVGGSIGNQALTINGNSVVTLANQANAISGLTFNNNGGAAPTLTPTGTLTVGVGGITATTSNPGTISTIGAGTLDLNGAGAFSISVGQTIVNGLDVAPWQAGLAINAAITNGGITKTGNGLLQLGGASTFAGGLTVSTGGLVLASDTNSLVLGDPVLTGPVGTGTLTMGANTTMLASGGTRTITNNVTFLGDTVFNGVNSLTLNGVTTLPTTWNATVTAPQMTVTIGDASPSLGTDVVNKSGLGTLVIGAYAGTINATGGLLFAGDGNTLSTPESVNLGGNVVLAGDTAVTVTRSGSAPNARNKTLQKVDLTTGSILAVNNQNGYGLEFTGSTTMTGVAHFSVATATASNVVQGLTLSGVVADGGSNLSMIKSGAGTLALTNAANTFGGVGSNIDVLNGILSVNSDGAMGDSNNAIILEVDGSTGTGFRSTGTFTTARTFNLNAANNAIEVTAGNTLTLATPFALSSATNTLTKNDNGVLEIAANNTGWNSTVTINGGSLLVTNNNALGTSAIVASATNALFTSIQLGNGVTINNALTLPTANGASGINSTGVIFVPTGTATYSGLITQNSGVGASYGAGDGATLNITGNIVASNSATFYAGTGGTVNLNSVYANGGAGGPTFNKVGAGALNVNVNQAAVTSVVNVNQGTLKISGSGVGFGSSGTGTSAVAINVGTTGVFIIDDSVGAASTHLNNRQVVVSGGTLTYTGNSANSTETSTGPLTVGRGGSKVILNQTGAGTVALTFSGLTLGTDQSGDFSGLNIGTATNKLLFTSAPGLTNGIIPRATVNGSTFASYGANGIFGYTAYNAATNINTPAATDNVDATAAMTTTALTASKSISALRFSNAAGTNISGAPFNTLSVTSGGILATGGGTNTLSVPVLTSGSTNTQMVVHVGAGTSLISSATLTNSTGLVKDGDGTLTISSPASNSGVSGVNSNTLSGTHNISRGTVVLNGGTNTLAPGVAIVMGGPGTVLDLNGNTQVIGAFLTDSSTPNTGGSVVGGTGSQLVISLTATDRSYSGTIGGEVNLVRSGPNTLTFFSPNTHTGSTLINGGTTVLSGAGSLLNTGSIAIQAATLTLDNGGFNDSTNRINDAAGISMRAGTLTVAGRAQTASSETLGAVSLVSGFNVINPNVGGTGINSMDLTLNNLSRPVGAAATLIVQGTNLGTIGSNSRVILTNLNGVATTNPAYSANGSGLTNNIVGGWAINNSDFLTYIPGLGLAPLNATGAAQYDLTNTFVGGDPTSNVRLTVTTAIPNGGSNVNAVSLGGNNIALNFATGSDTLNITSGGLIGPNNNNNIGATVDSGRITAGGLTPAASSDLYVFNRANTLTLNSRIIDNVNGGGSAVRAVFTASGGAINLTNTNASYTGGTVVNGGTLNLLASTSGTTIPLAATPANGLVINSATVTMGSSTNTVSGQIASGNIVTINGAGSNLNLFGNNTLEGLVLNNIGGGTGNLAVNTFSTATATGLGASGVLTIGNSGIVATSSNTASNTFIIGRTDFGATAKTIQVDTVNNGGAEFNPLFAGLNIQGIVGTTGGITKTGNGVLALQAQAGYTGPTNVNGGTLRIAVTNAGSRNSALTLASGTFLNLANVSTQWGSLAGSGTVFASAGTPTLTVGFDNTDTTFSGQFRRFNDASLGGVSLTKIGTGTMSMTGAQSFANGTTSAITVSGGSLRYVDAGAAFPATTVSGGATINVQNGGTLALDNSGTANVNNRLGMNTAGTLNLQGGTITVNGTPTAATPTTEQITSFNIVNGGGRVELTSDATNPLTFTITTLNTANGNGTAVFTGIDGSVAGTAGKAALVITTPNLIGGQGGGANGTTTMSVRHDILADASVSGLGTGFLVKDSAAGGTYRAMAAGELASAFALPLTTDVDPVTAGNQAAGTLNVGLTNSAATIGVNSVANTLTFSGTSSIGSSLGAAFGAYGPGGSLLTTSLSNAAASLTLAGATATINTAFGSTSTGTTPFAHVVTGGTLNLNGAFAIGGTAGFAKADGGTLNLNNKAYYTGTTSINGGTVNLSSGSANTLAVIPGAGGAGVSQVNLNGTSAVLNLNGQNQAIGALTSINPLPGQGGTVTSAAPATLSVNGTGTFGGQITGALAFTRAGNNTTTLTNANTYTGATIVRGGTLQLRDSGAIASTAGLTLNYGTLNWDNFGLNPTLNPTRVAANNPVALQGGTFTVNGAGSTDTVLTLNSVTVTGGNNNINVLPFINEGSTVKLTIGSLVRSQFSRSGLNINGFTTNNSGGTSALGGQGLTQSGQVIINGLDFAIANAVTTAGSNVVTVPSTADLFVGAPVTGLGLPANERITAITGPTTFTITTGTGVTAQASTTINANNLLVNLSIANGVTTAGSNIVTVPSTAGLIIGAPVSGTGLPAGEFITAITGPTTFTITTGTGVTAQAATTLTANNLNNNLIGGWAVADGNTFATYVTGQGVTVMGQNTGGITAPAFTGTDLSAALVATGNYSDGTSRTLSTGNKTANSIRFAGATAAQTITPVAGTTYTIGVGFIANQNQATTIGAVDATNTITGTGTDLYFYNNQNTLVVNPAIIGAQALVSNGPATLRIAPLFASNTYTGGTFINNGTTNLQAATGLVAIPGNLTINNANVTLGNATAGQIAPTSVVTINGGGSLNLFSYTTATSQSLDSLVFNNEGGTGNPAVTFGTPTALSTLTLTNANPITATNNSLATTPTISTSAATFSALTFSAANPVITVNGGLAETGLTISAPITGSGGFTTLTKSGNGTLALSGPNTFTTGFNLNQGGLMFGAASTGSPVVTSGPVGTGTLTIAGGTSVLSDGTARNIGNAVTVTGDFTFAGVTAGNNLTLSGAMDLGAAGRTLTVTSPAVTATISGAVTSTATAGVGLTKAGNGTLLLSNAANSLNGTGVAVNAGILKNGVNNALPAASNVAISAGAGYDLNNTDQTSNTISGAGFITNSANATKTLTVGGTASSSTFAGVITDNRLAQGSSRLALVKTGTGTLTLTGNNTYSGNTTVAGTLELSGGSLGGTAVTVSAGSGNTLKVTGNASIGSTGLNAGSLTIGAGANLNLQDGAINTLTLTNPTLGTNLTLNTAALSFDINATLNTVDKIIVGQNLTLNTGVSTVALNTLAGAFLSNGTYDLMTYASTSTLTGAFNFFGGGVVQQIGSGRSYTLSTSSTALQLIVANNVAANPVYWNGAISGNWNTQNITTNATNWQTGDGGPDTFALPGALADVFFASTTPSAANLSTTLGQDFSINSLTFTAATTSAVSISGNNLTVGSGGVTAEAGTGAHVIASNVVLGGSQTWTIDSASLAVSGNVAGTNALNKAGTGTLVLSGAGNAYTGDTNVNAGTVQLGASNVLPDGAGKGNVSVTGTLDLNGNSDTVNGLNGAGTVTNSATLTTSTVTVGGDNANGSFSGAIQNGAGTVGVVKTGTGTQSLSGANTYTGGTDVNAGTLVVGGSIAGNANVAAGAVLASGNNITSTIGGNVTLLSTGGGGGILAPGNTGDTVGATTIGGLSVNGDLTVGGVGLPASLAIEIGGSTGGTLYDQITVAGSSTVALTNANLDLSIANSFNPTTLTLATYNTGTGQLNQDGSLLFIIKGSTVAITGTFGNAGAADPNLTGFSTFNLGGQLFAISYTADFGTSAFSGAGNDVALMAIPEPNSMAMLAGSLGMALGLQRFRRRRSVQS